MDRKGAKALGLKRYQGKMCEKCRHTERYISTGGCVTCIAARSRRDYQVDPQRRAELNLASARKRYATDPAYREKKREEVRRYGWKARGVPEPTRPRPPLCECCEGAPGARELSADHDHSTGAFRGWLCGNCNMAIGKLGDSAAGLLKALAYISRAEQS